jgi:Ca2+-binding EF-hand superfamily protein
MKKMLAALLVLALCAATCPLLAQETPAGGKANTQDEARLKARFSKLDTNNDGKISKDEWKGRPRAFDRMDTNHDGSIGFDEFKAAQEKAGTAAKSGKRGRKRQ